MVRCFSIALIGSLFAPLVATADPLVLRDLRVTDAGVTLLPGSGYAVAVGAPLATCLSDVTLSAPSYDFRYDLAELQTESAESRQRSEASQVAIDPDGWLRQTLRERGYQAQRRDRTSHHLKVSLVVEGSSAALEESAGALSPAAQSMLARGDLVGFFLSCGSHYVRSVRRTARFVSLFSYETEEGRRDVEFESRLRKGLNGLGGATRAARDESDDAYQALRRRSQSRRLTIDSRGWGLGGDRGESLVSYDLDGFRAAIKAAFASTQDPRTGRVSAVEVVPWTEHPGFQAAVAGADGTALSLEQKANLLVNAEFLAEVEQGRRERMSRLDQATVCHEAIVWHHYKGPALDPAQAGRRVRNQRDASRPALLRELDAAVSREALNAAEEALRRFVGDGEAGLEACLAGLTGGDNRRRAPGLALRRFDTVAACVSLQQRVHPEPWPLLEECCLPELL